MHAADGEFRRADYNAEDVLIHQIVADYQSRVNGGDGLLRIMTFDPANDEIYVQTYSPYTDTYETDDDSQFTLPYEMEEVSPFVALETLSSVPSGDHATLVWSGLSADTTYEWYVELSSNGETITSPTWEFTTGP